MRGRLKEWTLEWRAEEPVIRRLTGPDFMDLIWWKVKREARAEVDTWKRLCEELPKETEFRLAIDERREEGQRLKAEVERLEAIVSYRGELACQYHTERDQARKVSDSTGDKLRTVTAERDQIRAGLDACQRDFAGRVKRWVDADTAQLRAALGAVPEWVYDEDGGLYCPCCKARRTVFVDVCDEVDGHAPDCPRQAALEQVEWTPTATGPVRGDRND
jgi:hypothetical protein